MEPDRRTKRMLQGLTLALGAPLGWLFLQWWGGRNPSLALAAEPWLYGYMLVGTSLAFGTFGWMLGRHEEDLERISITDSLTGLKNQRYFRARLDEEFESARRHSRPLSLLTMDLDFFKRVNDTHGHPMGDRLLAEVARAFAGQVRKGETLARVGGEEFSILLPGITLKKARQVGERIRQDVKKIRLATRRGEEVTVTVSLGLACASPGKAGSAESLVARADKALYKAKAQGRDRLVTG